MNAAKIKLITGGDMIPARRLRCDPFTYPPRFKLILSSNYLPKISDSMDEGIFRRIVIAPFDAKFDGKLDVTLKEQLKKPENMNAILSWCVAGCLMWQSEGLSEEPPQIKAIRNQYKVECDILGEFIEESCVVGNEYKVSVTELYRRFSEWVHDGGFKGKYNRNTFAEMMSTRGVRKDRPGGRKWLWFGIDLNYNQNIYA